MDAAQKAEALQHLEDAYQKIVEAENHLRTGLLVPEDRRARAETLLALRAARRELDRGIVTVKDVR